MTALLVQTVTATYLLDGDHLTRTPGIAPADWQVAELRRDTEPIEVLHAPPPVVGEPWQLLLAIRDDGVPTVRTTTPVVSVQSTTGQNSNPSDLQSQTIRAAIAKVNANTGYQPTQYGPLHPHQHDGINDSLGRPRDTPITTADINRFLAQTYDQADQATKDRLVAASFGLSP